MAHHNDLKALYPALGYVFKRPQLLAEALTHRSAARENNERLEFLGDAILSYVMAKELFIRYPKAKEGDLSRLRAALVQGETLFEIAAELNLGLYLRLGVGEMKSGGFRRKSILADAFEAIISAVYLDSDIETVSICILRWFHQRLESLDPNALNKDPKTRLQEYLQSQGQDLPQYSVLEVTGKEHDQCFHVLCSLPHLALSEEAKGPSRRKAEQAAAKKILEHLE